MVIHCFGQDISCVKAEKGADFIRAYAENGDCIFEATNVSDFSPYTLEDGEWSQPEMSEEERLTELESIVADLLFGGDGE